ncbi:MAG: dTMP kinase, partial [Bacillota bacterium]
AAGRIVVCDRYVDSSVAYQGFGLGVPLSAVWDINRFSTGDLMPDLTIILGRGADLESSERRRPTDRIEAREEYYHRRVRNGYLSLARRFPERILIVDTIGGVRRTAGIIRHAVAARLRDRKIEP